MDSSPEIGDSEQVRIIVADDDPICRSLVVAKLASLRASCLEAADGGEAWSLLLTETVQLAIIDLGMPNLDGFTLIRCVRGHPRTRHLPIVVVTSRDDKEAIQEAFNAGATSFLTKPLNWATFEHHIGYLLRLSRTAQEARTSASRADAAARVKDAVIASVSGEAISNATTIEHAVERILHFALESKAPKAVLDDLRQIKTQAQGVRATLSNASMMARLLSDNVMVDDRRVRLARVVAAASAEVEDLAFSREVRIELPAISESTIVSCDATALSEALVQLMRNAITHSLPGDAVRVQVEVHSDGMLSVSVADSGPGIEPAYLARCLAPLEVRYDALASNSNRIGMGIPLARAIARAHGGTVEIRSAPRQGTTALLVIPAERVESTCHSAA